MNQSPVDEMISTEPKTSTSSNRRRFRDPIQNTKLVITEAAPRRTNDNKDDDDSLEWDQCNLVPLHQDQDDGEDLRETGTKLPPRNVRNFKHQKATPRSVATQRRWNSFQNWDGRPLDMSDVAVPLVQQLFRMEDKFGIDDFESSIRSSVVALAVHERPVCGRL
jgi:hypothetical protein